MQITVVVACSCLQASEPLHWLCRRLWGVADSIELVGWFLTSFRALGHLTCRFCACPPSHLTNGADLASPLRSSESDCYVPMLTQDFLTYKWEHLIAFCVVRESVRCRTVKTGIMAEEWIKEDWEKGELEETWKGGNRWKRTKEVMAGKFIKNIGVKVEVMHKSRTGWIER